MRAALLAGLLVAGALAAGCHGRAHGARALRPVGAPCRSDGECGTSDAYGCAEDHPRGYCVSACRDDRDCARGAVCVRDPLAQVGACHVACDDAAACRALRPDGGYECVPPAGQASHGFCDPPGSRHLLRRLRAFWWR